MSQPHLKPYAHYKDSGIPWLSEVPAHWNVDRLKRSIQACRNGIWGEEAKGNEHDIPCVRVADFNRQTLEVVLAEPTIRNVSEKERIGRVLTQGDLLLEKSGGGELQPVGCVVLYNDPRPAICSNFIARIQLAYGMNSSYWRYVHAAAYSIRLTTASINQTSGIQNLDQQRYLDERVPFPTLEEQTAIAEFLDRETGKIDALVAEQRRLIDLLKEKRQAVISHAVTKGLNPNAPMKDSGIEWLGQIPAHWKVAKLIQITEKIGDGLHGTPQYVDESEFYFINGNNLSNGHIVITDTTKFVSLEEYQKHQVELKNSTLLMSINGTIGNLAFYRGESLMLGKSASYINCSDKISRSYLYYLLQSTYINLYFNLEVTGTTIYNLSLESIRKTPTLLPSKEEQIAIVNYLEKELEKIDDLISQAERAIELLQERRTALISAAVTGKIDVRQPVKELIPA